MQIIKLPRGKLKSDDKQKELTIKLALAEEKSRKAFLLADEINILYKWIKNDILSLVGPSYTDRKELLQFLVENLNSRLRTYFTLRRELGNEYLHFLRFFLNHRRFMRSEYAERIGKSQTELLTGEQHQHWLELLGFQLFKKPVVAQSVEVESDVVGTQNLQKAVRIGLFTELSSPSSSIEKLRKVA